MSPARRTIEADELARLEQLRSQAAEARQAIIDQAPTDPLGRVAWMAGVDGNPDYPFNNDLREAINMAREARFQWREISVALGEEDDQPTADRINAKQMWRNRTYSETVAGAENPGING